MTKDLYSGRAVFLQLSLLLSIFLILLLGSYFFLSSNIREQQDDAALLNAASLQRTLIERYTRHTSVIIAAHATQKWEEVAKHNKALQKNRQYIETNYSGLLNGGEVILSEDGSKTAHIARLANEENRQKLKKAEEAWEHLKRLAVTTLQSDVKTIIDDPRYDQIEEHLLATAKAQDEAVAAIRTFNEDKNRNLVFKQQIILTLGLLTFLLTLIYAKFFIARPIESSRNELEDHRLNLENRVREQTKDLTIAKESAEKAEQAAVKANQAKSDFLANMSHELRTPLNSIIGMSKMLSEDLKEREDVEMVGTVHKAALSLLDIVNDILDLSKIEAQQMVLEAISFDFKNTMSTIVETLAPIASAKGISLNYKYLRDNIPFLVGDPVRMARILTNLLGNAIKYTMRGHVGVSVDYTDAGEGKIELLCRIEDTGIGIPAEKLNMIFQKFSQADESTTRKYGGTGLGLAITKELVEMMGGKIGVESRVGQGSTFWFSIPFDTAKEMHVEPAARISLENALSSQAHKILPENVRILIAEDHALNQVFIKKMLERFGLNNYLLVENGKEAVTAYQENPFDIILMDCHMPEMNGYEATEAVRVLELKTDRRAHIIAMTADAMVGTREKCIEVGMDDYISKPIDIARLRSLLEERISL